MKPIIAPSILSADFAYLAKDLEMVNRSEADWVHRICIGWFNKYVKRVCSPPLH